MSRHCDLSQPRDLAYRRPPQVREKAATERGDEGGAKRNLFLGKQRHMLWLNPKEVLRARVLVVRKFPESQMDEVRDAEVQHGEETETLRKFQFNRKLGILRIHNGRGATLGNSAVSGVRDHRVRLRLTPLSAAWILVSFILKLFIVSIPSPRAHHEYKVCVQIPNTRHT